MISVVIPLYNKEKTIKNSIMSILSQDYTDFELVLVDDGSTDNSIAKVQEINDARIQIYEKQNGGPASARNYGIQKSKGEWIVFLDADDYFLPGALKHFDYLVNTYKNINCFVCNYDIQTHDKCLPYSRVVSSNVLKNNFLSWCRKKCYPRPGNVLIRKDIVCKYLFKTNLKRNEDVEWMFRIMHNNLIYRSSQRVMVYNRDDLQASNKRQDIFEDFCAYLDFTKKDLWERVALYSLYTQAKRLYPQDYKSIYPNQYHLVLGILYWCCKILNRIEKSLYKTY